MSWKAALPIVSTAPYVIQRIMLEHPGRRDFGISQITRDGHSVEVTQRDLARWPFCTLTAFSGPSHSSDRVLLVSPLSGHFATILREMVISLLPNFSVYVTNWLDARFVPLSKGDFGFDDNIETIMRSIELLGPDVRVCALCQAVAPTLAAVAILSEQDAAKAPRSLVLMGGPVDPLANPTRVVRLLKQQSIGTIEEHVLDTVPLSFPGSGRRVYPAFRQLEALLAYLYRHFGSGDELLQKVFFDDGMDPIRFPFFDLFTSLMDLPAKYFLENIQKVFLERQLWNGDLRWHGQRVDFRTIRNTALMTVEGEDDDIAAPGQTSAAHRLCLNIPSGMRHHLLQQNAGHFSLFYGRTWREKIQPEINAFWQTCGTTYAPHFQQDRRRA